MAAAISVPRSMVPVVSIGDLHHQRHAAIEFAHGVKAGGGGDFGDVEVELGFDEEGIDAAVEEAAGLFGVRVEEGVVVDVAQGGGFGARADGAGNEAGFAVLKAGGGLAGEFDGGDVHVVAAVGEAKFRQDDFVGAEGIGLHAVGPGGIVAGVDFFHDVRAREDQDVNAVFLFPEVFQGEVEVEYLRAHTAVKDHDAVLQQGEEW